MMNVRIFSGLLLCLVSFSLAAGNLESKFRIFTLLPTLDTPLAVEPAIPKNFVAMSKSGTLDLQDWVYWGPKDVVEAYFKDQSLKHSILRCRLSQTVKQIGPHAFSSENDDLCKLMAPLGLKRLFDVRMKWGKYPIYAISAEFSKKWLYAAWVGLSDPQGSTLMFELIYSGTKPTSKDFELWDVFLDKTTILPEPACSEAYSIAYNQGVTEMCLYEEKFAVIGEQRYSDKLMQIVVDLKKSNLKCELDTVNFASLPPSIDLGGIVDGLAAGPGAKVYFSLIRADKSRFTQMIPVFVKAVDDFVVDAESAREKGFIVYEQQLPCMLKEFLK